MISLEPKLQQTDRKVVVITGVTHGLGWAMTDEFIHHGHIVVGCGRSRSKIAELKDLFHEPNEFTALDVASDEQVGVWARQVLKVHRAPDLLLNNAAVINQNAVLWEVSAKEFSDVIDINLKGMANVIHSIQCRKLLRARGIWLRAAQTDGLSDIIKLFGTNRFQALSLNRQFLVDLDRFLGHQLVSFFSAANQGEVRACGDSLVSVGIEANT